jgi:hypothetical protein
VIGRLDELEPRVLMANAQAHLEMGDEAVREQLNQIVFRRMMQTGEIQSCAFRET